MFHITNLLNRDSNSGENKEIPCFLKDFINDELEHRLEVLNQAFRSRGIEEIKSAYERALEAFHAKKKLKELSFRSFPLYLTEYYFLKDVFSFLVQDSKEGFCVVTGPEAEDNLFSLSRWLEPEMKIRTATGAEPEFGSMLDLLIKLEEEQGNRLTAYFHSHPGEGIGATEPSDVDIDTQEKLERGGYPVIGAIFSRDGYIRFFSDQRDFEVEISGKGGEQIEKNVVKLSGNQVNKVSNTNGYTGR